MDDCDNIGDKIFETICDNFINLEILTASYINILSNNVLKNIYKLNNLKRLELSYIDSGIEYLSQAKNLEILKFNIPPNGTDMKYIERFDKLKTLEIYGADPNFINMNIEFSYVKKHIVNNKSIQNLILSRIEITDPNDIQMLLDKKYKYLKFEYCRWDRLPCWRIIENNLNKITETSLSIYDDCYKCDTTELDIIDNLIKKKDNLEIDI